MYVYIYIYIHRVNLWVYIAHVGVGTYDAEPLAPSRAVAHVDPGVAAFRTKSSLIRFPQSNKYIYIYIYICIERERGAIGPPPHMRCRVSRCRGW